MRASPASRPNGGTTTAATATRSAPPSPASSNVVLGRSPRDPWDDGSGELLLGPGQAFAVVGRQREGLQPGGQRSLVVGAQIDVTHLAARAQVLGVPVHFGSRM